MKRGNYEGTETPGQTNIHLDVCMGESVQGILNNKIIKLEK